MEKAFKFSKLVLMCVMALSLWGCASNKKAYEDISPSSDLGAATIGEDSSVSTDYSESDYTNIDTSIKGDDSSSGFSDSDSSYSSSTSNSEPALAETLPSKKTSSSNSFPQSSSVYESSSASTYGSSGGRKTYIVKRGDTLMEIAFAHYGDYLKWKDIYRLNRNKMQSPETMPVGIELILEDTPDISITRNGNPYVIKPGDTLKTIAKKVYGTTAQWQKIWQNNPELIKNPKQLYYGFTLYYQPDSGADYRQPTYDESY